VIGEGAALGAADAATRARWHEAGAAVLRDAGAAVGAWLRAHEAIAVVLRPDRYLLGAARDARGLAEISALIT